MSDIIKLKPILAISPSLAETFRDCLLRAVLYRISEIQSFAPSRFSDYLGFQFFDRIAVLDRSNILPLVWYKFPGQATPG